MRVVDTIVDIGTGVNKMLWNNVIIKADKFGKEKIKTESGLIFYQDIILGQDHHDAVMDHGVVSFKPEKHNEHKEIKINKGDVVYTHHSLCQDHRRIMINGELYYWMDYSSCYFVKEKDGDIRMLHDWNLIEPIEKEWKIGSILIYDPDDKYKVQQGKLSFISESLQELGLKKGMTVFYESYADYRMNVDGNLYFRMPDKLIFAYLDENEKIQPVGKWNFVKPIVEHKIKSDILIIPETDSDRMKSVKGTVVYASAYLKNFGIGKEDIIFYKAVNDKVNINGEELHRVDNKYVDGYITKS